MLTPTIPIQKVCEGPWRCILSGSPGKLSMKVSVNPCDAPSSQYRKHRYLHMTSPYSNLIIRLTSTTCYHHVT